VLTVIFPPPAAFSSCPRPHLDLTFGLTCGLGLRRSLTRGLTLVPGTHDVVDDKGARRNVDDKDDYEAQRRARLNADNEDDSIDEMM
jgi:hypothetical protein